MIATISKERWLQQYQLVKTQFWILMFSICFLIFSFSAAVICRDSAEYPAAAVFEIEFNSAIAEYEATGTKIYSYGRQCLIKAAQQQGLTTKAEILKLIKDNEKYFKK